MNRRICSIQSLICQAVVCVITACLAYGFNPAHAMNGVSMQEPTQEGGSGGSRQTHLSQDDLDDLYRTCEVDDTQKEMIEALYGGYQAAFREGQKRVADDRDKIRKEAEGNRDPNVWREIGPKMSALYEDWAVESNLLIDQFFTDVRALLSKEQDAKWPKFERERRRRLLLRVGNRISNEGIDLIQILKSLELDEEVMNDLATTTEAYAEDLDRVLLERERVSKESQERSRELASSGRHDELQKMYEELHRRRIDLSEVNSRYAELLAGQLPSEYADTFRQKVLEASFPRIYRQGRAARNIEYVLTLDDLTAEQRTSIESIRANFEFRAAPIREDMMRVQKEMEREPPRMFVNRDRGSGPGGRRGDPQRRAWTDQNRALHAKMTQIEQEIIDQVFEILTPEQQARAPKGTYRPTKPTTPRTAGNEDN
jgi:hypothetical protein